MMRNIFSYPIHVVLELEYVSGIIIVILNQKKTDFPSGKGGSQCNLRQTLEVYHLFSGLSSPF